MRDLILREIRRLASENDGRPPGKMTFARETGITETKWSGVYWSRWGDALAAAGLAPNTLQKRSDSKDLLIKVAELCRELRRVPTGAEMKLRRRSDQAFPNRSTLLNHFPTNADLLAGLRHLASEGEYADLIPLLPQEVKRGDYRPSVGKEGSVYLIKSGDHYKIGRSDELERRVREVRIALPESMTLVHAIRTDDPAGIEAYWHRRFASRRANGEWFRLTGDDVRAFARRTFQ